MNDEQRMFPDLFTGPTDNSPLATGAALAQAWAVAGLAERDLPAFMDESTKSIVRRADEPGIQ
jgi:hypothetical protein